MTVLSFANTTAQWYADNFPGIDMGDQLEKGTLHSTETVSYPGYGGGASAPTCTYFPRRREFRQHFPNQMSARALRDPSSTPVRENRDKNFQLEIVAYSDYVLSRSDYARRNGGIWIGDLEPEHYDDLAMMAIELNENHGIRLESTVEWREGQKTFVSGVRLSSRAFDTYRGWLAHMHVPGNTHWDVGGFFWSQLAVAIDHRRGTPAPPPVPPEEEHLMYVSRYGRSQWVLVKETGAVPTITPGTVRSLTLDHGLTIRNPPLPNAAIVSLRALWAQEEAIRIKAIDDSISDEDLTVKVDAILAAIDEVPFDPGEES